MTIRGHQAAVSCCFMISLLFCSTISPVFAQTDKDKKDLLIYFSEDELVVEAPTRSAKPVSQVAENVSVITARDIERMNAHTVADVLNTITGIQVFMTSGPGSPASATYIQGSEPRNVTVLIDGVSLNNLSDNVVDLGSLPVQNIEKIEIVKGPASSAWGSALGGVINIITKTGRLADGAVGLVSASYGERNTGDFRAETRGKQGAFGYYFSAGRLQTNGLTPHFNVSNNNAYAKLDLAVTDSTNLGCTLGFENGAQGDGDFPAFDLSIEDVFRNVRSTLTLNTSFTDDTELQLSFWTIRQIVDFKTFLVSTGNRIALDHYSNRGFGSSAELIYKGTVHHLAVGVDQDSRTLTSNKITGEEQALRKAAAYLSDTLSFGQLSITPGVRFDYTSSNGNITSPSIGVTFKAAEATIFRADAAHGFGVPPLIYTFGDNERITGNPDLKMERVSSYQAGVETAAINYLWVKVSLFRHEIRDAIFLQSNFPSSFQAVNTARQRRQGFAAEMKTASIFNTSLTAGAEFVSIKDLNTGQSLVDIPIKIYDVGLVYDDETSIRAYLKGRYIDWHSDPAAQGDYGNVIFDLNVAAVLSRSDAKSLEAFTTAHNLFSGSQYPIALYKNPARWVETGLRYRF